MKKSKLKSVLSLLLIFAVVLSFSVTAFGADSTVTYRGMKNLTVDSGSEYTKTDLFDGFKNVMPGDNLTETITIKNDARDCDYIKVYLTEKIHDEQGNPLTYSEAYESLDGKDQHETDVRPDGQRDETVATMQEFLSQLTMKVYNAGKLIYTSHPENETEPGALMDSVLLGTLSSGQSQDVTVELSVPKELGNKYANRVGEVDWVFKVEAFDYPTPPTTDSQLTVRKVWEGDQAKDRPSQVTVNLLKDGKVQETQVLNASNQWTYTWGNLSRWNKWSVEEANVPEGYAASYETTGNTTVITNTKTVAAGDVTVKKVWKGDSKDRPSSVKVQLYRDGEVYDTATLKKSTGWTYTWENLDQSYAWNVKEIVPKGYKATYQTRGSKVTITNTKQKADAEVKPVSLTVKKAWDDKDSKKRPDSVKITLYNGKKAVETVHLGQWNSWTYTWDDLDADGDWKVVEDQVPKGYVPSYRVKKGVVTVTNTAKLIQTGQRNWPVLLCGGLGVLVLAAGVILILRGRKKEHA